MQRTLTFPFLALAATVGAQAQAPVPTIPPAAAKGLPDTTPPDDAEWRLIRGGRAARYGDRLRRGPRAVSHDALPGVGVAEVLFDAPDDGRTWALGGTYKASFGPDGFTYVPFLGSDAPRNFPVRFEVKRVQVGAGDLPLAAPSVRRHGSLVTVDRGAVAERYRCALDHVEQTFVVDAAAPGDVLVELRVVGELQEVRHLPGLQFGNELGHVAYGAAWLVDGERKVAIESAWTGSAILLRVPAAARADGPVVIDPILSTYNSRQLANTDALHPDIAYDVDSNGYLAVWEYAFSAADHDIITEFRGPAGEPLAGTQSTVDITGRYCANPRVANHNTTDRFLVVMERVDPAAYSGRSTIFGRRRAVGAFVSTPEFLVSDVSYPGECYLPDIGGDPHPNANGHYCVAWQVHRGQTSEIHATLVTPDDQVFSSTTILVSTGVGVFANVEVSKSNGRGFLPDSGWLVVYGHRYTANDWDVHAGLIALDGTMPHRGQVLDFSQDNDVFPSVASPKVDGSVPEYLVTYERQTNYVPMALVVRHDMVFRTLPQNLGALGLGGFWVRAACDGIRFAVTNAAAAMTVATLATPLSGFVLHEAPQVLPGVVGYPQIVSKCSANGGPTEYAIVGIDHQPDPDQVKVAIYQGRQSGPTISRRPIGCDGLDIGVSGEPFLGEALYFLLSNTNGDATGYVFGFPAHSTTWCAACPIGVDLAAGSATYFLRRGVTLPVPVDPSFAGLTLAAQGFGFGSGSCPGTVRLSDAIDFTIR